MPIYDWRCDDCGHVTPVFRSMKEYETAPDDGCEKCQSKNQTRIVSAWKKEQTHLVHGGKAPWFEESYFGPRGIPTGR